MYISWQGSSKDAKKGLKKGCLNFPFSHQCNVWGEYVILRRMSEERFIHSTNIYWTPSAYQTLPFHLRRHSCSKRGIILQERRKSLSDILPQTWRKGFLWSTKWRLLYLWIPMNSFATGVVRNSPAPPWGVTPWDHRCPAVTFSHLKSGPLRCPARGTDIDYPHSLDI